MTVAELIAYLKTQPQEMLVAYRICSEQCLLSSDEIRFAECCEPRPDGWIEDKRPDKPTKTYLMFPGH